MLFIMRGTSCSGKDTFINQRFPDSTNVISSDFFRQMLFGDISNQRNNDEVFAHMHGILEKRLISKVEWTVLNATHLRLRDMQPAIELCKKYHTPFTILSIQPPSIEELKERNEKRAIETGFKVPEYVLERHHERYFACMPTIVQEASYNKLCSLIEFDQQERVLRHVTCNLWDGEWF